MVSDRLTKQEWLDLLTSLEEFYNKSNERYNDQQNQFIISSFVILGELYDDDSIRLQGLNSLESLDLHKRIPIYSAIAKSLHNNNKFESQSIYYFTKMYELQESLVNSISNYDTLPSMLNEFTLSVIFTCNIKELYDKAFSLSKKIIQRKLREQQIVAYYRLTDYLIDANIIDQQGKMECFQIAEEMYKASSKTSMDVNNLPIILITLEQSMREHNTSAIIKLFNFFLTRPIYDLNPELFKILNYLKENGHNNIFTDYMNQILERFKIKEEQNLWTQTEKQLATKFLVKLFEQTSNWNLNELLIPIKDLFNTTIEDDVYWDFSFEVAKVVFGFTSKLQLAEYVKTITDQYTDAFANLVWESVFNPKRSNMFENARYAKLHIRIVNICNKSLILPAVIEVNKTINSYFSTLEQAIIKINQEIITDPTERDRLIRIFFYKVDLKSFLIEFQQSDNEEKFNLFYPIFVDKEKAREKGRLRDRFTSYSIDIESYIGKEPAFDDIFSLFLDLQYNFQNKHIPEIVLILDHGFENNLQDLTAGSLKLLERTSTSIPRWNLNLSEDVTEKEIQQAIWYQLFFLYCFKLLDKGLFDQSEASAILQKVQRLLPNYLKLELSLHFAKGNFISLSQSYLEDYLKKPSNIAWMEDDRGIHHIHPTGKINMLTTLMRTQTLTKLGRIDEAINELTFIFNSVYKEDTKNQMYIELFLKLAIILKQDTLVKSLVERLITKIIDSIKLGLSFSDLAFDMNFFTNSKPEYLTESKWVEIKTFALAFFTNQVNEYILDPFSVPGFFSLIKLVKYLFTLGDTSIAPPILNKIEACALHLCQNYFPADLLMEFPEMHTNGLITEEKTAKFTMLVKEIIREIPRMPVEQKEINYRVLEFIIFEIIQLYKLSNYNEIVDKYMKMDIEIMNYYKDSFPLYKERLYNVELEQKRKKNEFKTLKEEIDASINHLGENSFQKSTLGFQVNKLLEDQVKNY